MSADNSCYFDMVTVGDNHTKDDLIKIETLFQDKLKEMDIEDWFIEEIFTDIFSFSNGKISIYGDGESMRWDESKNFIKVLKMIVDMFRDLDFELDIPEMQPYWATDWGPGDCYKTEYELSKYYKEEMGDLKEGESEDKEAIYIDDDGEEYDMTEEWYDGLEEEDYE